MRVVRDSIRDERRSDLAMNVAEELPRDVNQTMGSLPACRRGCRRNFLVMIPVHDAKGYGYMIQCSSCNAGTPILGFDEVIRVWKEEFGEKAP